MWGWSFLRHILKNLVDKCMAISGSACSRTHAFYLSYMWIFRMYLIWCTHVLIFWMQQIWQIKVILAIEISFVLFWYPVVLACIRVWYFRIFWNVWCFCQRWAIIYFWCYYFDRPFFSRSTIFFLQKFKIFQFLKS